MSIEEKDPDADKHDIDIPGQVNIDLENGEIRQVSRSNNLNSSVVIFMFIDSGEIFILFWSKEVCL